MPAPGDYSDTIAAFERELIAFGLVLPPGGVVVDGRIQRPDDGQHPRKRNGAGWYILHETPTGLLVGRAGSWWRDRGSFNWNSRGKGQLRPADRRAIADLELKVKAERAEHYRQGAERAEITWAAGMLCGSHSYLTRKRVKSHNLRVDDRGRLLVPLRVLGDDTLRGLQWIDPAGEKRFTFGSDRQKPTCFIIGEDDLADAAIVAVVEGYATGATVHAATGWPVVVAFDAGMVEKIAKSLRDLLPKATLVFAGDHDASGTGQTKAQRAARAAGGVVALPPVEGTDWNDHAIGKDGVCEAQGLDDVRARLVLAAGQVDLPPTVTLVEAETQLHKIIGGFFAQAQTWRDLPPEQRPNAPPAHLADATMGAGKSTIARSYGSQFLAKNDDAAAGFSLPLHRLTTEQAPKFKAESGIQSAIWLGMEQPDPERTDGKAMCLQPELSNAARDAGHDTATVCKVCPSRVECGTERQKTQTGLRAWYFPHNLVFHERPKAIPQLSFLVVDEKFHDAGLVENIRLAASTLESDVSDVPHAGDRDLLRELRAMLLAAFKIAAASATPPEKRARLLKASLEVVGLTADQAADAKRIEWTRKPKVKLSGDVPDMVRALQEMAGRFTPKVPMLWRLVEALLRGDHDTSTNIELEPDAELQGGDGYGLVIWLHDRLPVHESWRCPTLVLDGTARLEIIRHWFPELLVAPTVHIEAPHQKVTWIRASFAKARLVPSRKASEKRNKARLQNVEDLRRYIEVQAARYRRDVGGVDVLVVVQESVEALLREGALPSNVAVEHFNNLRGTNAYEQVRAIIVVGRTLPAAATIQRRAECIVGHPVVANDPLVEALRWSICEAELLQVIARARGIRRTAATPLDVLLLGDVPLPLLVNQVASWDQAKPTPVELMAARGMLPDCPTNTKGYWATVQAALPDVFKDVQAAKDAAKASQWRSSMSLYLIDGFHRESWQAMRAKPPGGRYAIPVLVDPFRRASLAAVLDLVPDEGPEAPPPAASRPAPEKPAPTVDLTAPVPAEPVAPDRGGVLAVGLDPPPVQKREPIGDGLDAEPPAAWSDYAGGPIPPGLAGLVRARQLDAGITQQGLAARIGISRPQLANALSGTYGLSAAAAARLRDALASLPASQGRLL